MTELKKEHQNGLEQKLCWRNMNKISLFGTLSIWAKLAKPSLRNGTMRPLLEWFHAGTSIKLLFEFYTEQ